MATNLYFRNTQTSGITDTGDTNLYDLSTTAGTSADTAVVNTAGSGTNIQFTKTAGGASVAWITGRVPSGGVTLTTATMSAWLHESAIQANALGRFRFYKYSPGPTITELGGSPFDTASELTVAAFETLQTCNYTDTAFVENDRLLVRLFITNTGTMGSGRTCTFTFNAAAAATGDSFVALNENVTFKPRDYPFVASAATQYALTGKAVTFHYYKLAAAAGAYTWTIADTITRDGGIGAVAGAYTLSGVAVGLTKSGSTYSLACSAGAYTLSGVAAGLRSGRKLAHAAGSYTLTGVAAGLTKVAGYTLVAGPGAYVWTIADTITRAMGEHFDGGSYTLSGVAVNFAKTGGYTLNCSTGSYTLSGVAAGLTYVTSRKIICAPGSYTWNLADLVTRTNVGIASPGSYTLTGGSVSFTAPHVGYSMVAVPGSYTITGATTVRDFTLPLTSGAYTLSGGAITFRKTSKLAAAASSNYPLTGQPITFHRGRVLAAAAGSYSIVGGTTNVRAAKRLTSVSGAYTLSGVAAGLTIPGSRTLVAASGAYALTGGTVNFHFYKVVCVAGSYAYIGNAVALRSGRRLIAETGTYAFNGVAATIGQLKRITAAPGSYTLGGVAAGFRAVHYMALDTGNYPFNGKAVGLTVVNSTYRMELESGAYVLSGGDLVARKSRFALYPERGVYTLLGGTVLLYPHAEVLASERRPIHIMQGADLYCAADGTSLVGVPFVREIGEWNQLRHRCVPGMIMKQDGELVLRGQMKTSAIQWPMRPNRRTGTR